MKYRPIFLGLLLVLILGIFISFAQAFAQSDNWEPVKKVEISESLFNRGKQLYGKQCAVCHGVSGNGEGSAAYLLYPKPRNFNLGEFRMISSSESLPTDEDLFKTISRGMPGSSMPSWVHLPEDDRWALVYYVRYLTGLGQAGAKGLSWDQIKEMASSKIDPSTVLHPQVPEATPERISLGRELFVKGCVSCHGTLGKGDGQMNMIDSLGIATRPRDLTAGIFKGESTAVALYRRLALGLPGSPMPSYKDAFTEDQIWDLVHYIRTLPADGKMDRALMSKHSIQVKKTNEEKLGPGDEGWRSVAGEEINLMPLWWRNERVEALEVKASYDGNFLMLQLSWPDSTQDNQSGSVTDFSDGAAIQFSHDTDPPLFSMGSSDQPVSFWNWKAAWENPENPQEMIGKRYPNYLHSNPPKELYEQTLTGSDAGNPVSNPEARPGAEEAHAKGFSSYTSLKIQMEKVEAKSLWKDGRWYVVFKRELKTQESERVQFESGKKINVAFAVWDGTKQDRNGQKMISIWNDLQIE